MAKPTQRTYSRHALEAAELLGAKIRLARIERKFTVLELAERAGISRGLLQRIEKGDMSCGLGSVLEVASLVGIPLFASDREDLSTKIRRADNYLTLLPKSVRRTPPVIDDDF